MQNRPQIMGVLNITPDSFSDGGKFQSIDAAVAQARRMWDAGADVIDIGGESTRPGSEAVPAEQQIERVMPVIREIRQQLPEAVLSIDTTSFRVAEAALDAGAGMLNDVSAGRDFPDVFKLAAESGVPLVLMHMQGTPKTMQQSPKYKNVLLEVRQFLQDRAEAAIRAGVREAQLWIDPGIGFGKRRQDNLELINGLDYLVSLGLPVLLGTSRKRFMGNLCEITEPSQLVGATCATTALGVAAGVRMFRVHDVLENRQAADVAWHVLRSP